MPDQDAVSPSLTRSSGAGRPPSAEKHAALMKAATEAFARDGFDAASVDAIAQQAMVSKRTLYKHFQSKEKLFEALVGEAALRIEQLTGIEYSATDSLRAQLLRFSHLSHCLTHEPETALLLRAVVLEHIRHPERVEPLLSPWSRRGYGFSSWVAAACADGRLHGDPERMAHLLGSLMRSLLFWPALIRRGSVGLPAGADELSDAIDMFLQYYGASHVDRH